MKRKLEKRYVCVWDDGTRWEGDDPEWYRLCKEAVKKPLAPAVRTEVHTVAVYR